MNIEKTILDISRSCNEKKFQEFVSFISNETISTQKNICSNIFKTLDVEIEKSTPNEVFLRILVAVPIELALLHQIQEKNAHNTDEFIDFISSHLLARSNATHESLRLGITIFYAHIKNQPAWKKQKILERFGENILESVFQIYSKNKEKSSIAFSFLSENLESFLSLSQELALMTNAFLQKFMFKYQADFIQFIRQYSEYLLKKNQNADFFIIHLSFLIRQAFELENEILMCNLIKEFLDYVYGFEADKEKTSHNLKVFCKIMMQSKSLASRDVSAYVEKSLKDQNKILSKNIFKIINLKNYANIANASNHTKKKKSAENLSVFQKILLLCSSAE